MDAAEVKKYLTLMPDSMLSLYTSLSPEEQDKQLFMATELLGDFYKIDKITPRSVALQLLYNLDAEGEEFARLKRHGIQSMSAKDTSVTFASMGAISPDVLVILGEPKQSRGSIGRLI